MMYSLFYDLFLGAAPVIENDDRLLADARNLDSRALAAIHDRFYPDIYRYLLYRTNDEHTAEDLASEVFMRLLDVFHAGRPPAVLRAWLFGVASNLAADHFRRQSRRPQVALSEELVAEDTNLEMETGARLAAKEVREALHHLTDEQQQVLALRFGDGRSIDDTASLMQKSVTAVKQLQFRAVAALRRHLEGSL
ncbi:MAG: sigma-70 family RNA polymerase sigma factor [Chloroflexi bacterium]|nr:sigma-70 family RNA polymerase sigma factor [Chloroflexota bacterium]